MNLFSQTLNKIFKTGKQKELDKVKPLIVQINDQEQNFKSFKNDDFKAKTHLLKKNLQEGDTCPFRQALNKVCGGLEMRRPAHVGVHHQSGNKEDRSKNCEKHIRAVLPHCFAGHPLRYGVARVFETLGHMQEWIRRVQEQHHATTIFCLIIFICFRTQNSSGA